VIAIVEGDILKAKEDIIGHQVNCCGVMGSGLAKQLKDTYSNLHPMYKEFCDNHNPYELLGECHIVSAGSKKIANLFGQLNYGRKKVRYTDYDALRLALYSLGEYAARHEMTIALPWGIGCGLANGDWDVVYQMIDEVFENGEATLYKWKG
jgi:O-acetyl-ADP-ribose deacetylase (regulator of RNase III)